jgi:hypothetical protein
MTLRLRPVMSASFCSVCASGLLSCANCACITCGAQKGPETSAQSEAQGPRPRPRQLHPWSGLTRVPAQGAESQVPNNHAHSEAPPTRFGACPGYLQLLCGEGRPRALGWLGLTVLFRGHCPLQRETVPWGATEAADHASPSLLVAAWKGRGGGELVPGRVRSEWLGAGIPGPWSPSPELPFYTITHFFLKRGN